MPETCGVPSMSLGPCDLPRGHEGRMHGSAGDGFYARCGECRKDLQPGDWHPPTKPKTLGYICGECKES